MSSHYGTLCLISGLGLTIFLVLDFFAFKLYKMLQENCDFTGAQLYLYFAFITDLN